MDEQFFLEIIAEECTCSEAFRKLLTQILDGFPFPGADEKCPLLTGENLKDDEVMEHGSRCRLCFQLFVDETTEMWACGKVVSERRWYDTVMFTKRWLESPCRDENRGNRYRRLVAPGDPQFYRTSGITEDDIEHLWLCPDCFPAFLYSISQEEAERQRRHKEI